VAKETHLLRETMAALQAQLEGLGFARIHRNAIVNLERVATFAPLFNGQFEVQLLGGQRLTLSRFYRDRLEQQLGRRL
jgi:two-component system LytT family response regulator